MLDGRLERVHALILQHWKRIRAAILKLFAVTLYYKRVHIDVHLPSSSHGPIKSCPANCSETPDSELALADRGLYARVRHKNYSRLWLSRSSYSENQS